jgi:hypothetical protein
MDVASWR